jgi:hypothetical protein
VIPNPNDAPAVLFEPSGTPFIGLAIGMLAAVDFDNEAMPDGHEIDDVGPDRALPAKLVSRQSAIPQHQPQSALRVCLVLSQSPSGFAGH